MNNDEFVVYDLFKIDTKGNSHTINRDETWTLRKRKTFVTKEAAEKFIIKMSMKDIVRFQCPATDEFCREFCFTDDKYIKHREFFLGKPDINKIKKALENDGIKFIKN